MSSATRRRLWLGALVVLLAGICLAGGHGAPVGRPEETMLGTTRIPPIDAAVPRTLRTATFALG